MAAERILMIGPPGSGKGTQAARVAGRLGLRHLSTGDLLREAVAARTELGREAEGYMRQGLLVPDDVMLGLIREQLAALKGQGWILDGFPRTVAQAEGLARLLEERGPAIDAVILIDVDAREIVERLTQRRVCEGCGAVYGRDVPTGPDPNRCAKCGGELVTRPDDREETVRRRIEVYERETAPVLEFYRRAPGIEEIDGTRELDEVTAEILCVLR